MQTPREPQDVDAAYESWGATCGPAALAAVLGLDLEDVRAAVSTSGRFQGYMNLTHMRNALEFMRVRYQALRSPTLADLLAERSIVCVQWSGPWNSIPRAAAAYRHFIATASGCVYDVNAGWVEPEIWTDRVAPELIPKRGDGSWLYTWAAALS